MRVVVFCRGITLSTVEVLVEHYMAKQMSSLHKTTLYTIIEHVLLCYIDERAHPGWCALAATYWFLHLTLNCTLLRLTPNHKLKSMSI